MEQQTSKIREVATELLTIVSTEDQISQRIATLSEQLTRLQLLRRNAEADLRIELDAVATST